MPLPRAAAGTRQIVKPQPALTEKAVGLATQHVNPHVGSADLSEQPVRSWAMPAVVRVVTWPLLCAGMVQRSRDALWTNAA